LTTISFCRKNLTFAIIIKSHSTKLKEIKMANKNQDGDDEFDSLSVSVLSDCCSASSASACFLAAAALLRLDFITVRGYIGRNPDKPAMKQRTGKIKIIKIM